MEIIDFILHIEEHLREFVQQYDTWIYALLFLIIFAETGFVVTPFLPGDSLLFTVGVLAADGIMDANLAVMLLIIAAITGDALNYWIGRFVGPKVFYSESSRFLNRKHLDRAHAFYEKYGGKAIVLARFVPIVRTFAPFVAGIGTMHYGKFLAYNAIGGVLWVSLFIYAGFHFGNIPIVKQNIKLVIIGIIIVSILPIIFEWWRAKRESAS